MKSQNHIQTWAPHPPGFRELCERVGKFSGKKGYEDFCLWLADFEEVSQDCKRIEVCGGPSKSHLATDSDYRREGIVELHQDIVQSSIWYPHGSANSLPKLQYKEFGSVQGLLESMREY